VGVRRSTPPFSVLTGRVVVVEFAFTIPRMAQLAMRLLPRRGGRTATSRRRNWVMGLPAGSVARPRATRRGSEPPRPRRDGHGLVVRNTATASVSVNLPVSSLQGIDRPDLPPLGLRAGAEGRDVPLGPTNMAATLAYWSQSGRDAPDLIGGRSGLLDASSGWLRSSCECSSFEPGRDSCT
jgi:hypothetical protein